MLMLDLGGSAIFKVKCSGGVLGRGYGEIRDEVAGY